MSLEIAKAEEIALGSILIDAERCLPIAVNGGVAGDWFTDDLRKLAWAAMVSLWAKREPVDTVSVVREAATISKTPKQPLSGVEVQPMVIANWTEGVPTSAHFEYYLGTLRGLAMERRVKKAGTRFSEDLTNGVDVESAAQHFLASLTKIIGMGAAAKTIDKAEVLNRIREEYKAAYQKRVVEKDLEYTPGIPLPWKKPNVASQGVQEGLYYLGARPSVGKTAFTLNLIRYWCERGVRVAFNSLDMAIKPMLKRPIGELSRVSLTKASFGTTSHEELAAIDRAIDGTPERLGVAKWPLTLIQERDVETFRAWCVAARSAGNLDIAIVDFVQLMGTRARYANDNEKLEHISGVLKSIAIDLDIPIIALSQLNRACEDDGGRVPTASDLRGSGALEQDATAVWILHADRDVQKKWDDLPDIAKPLGLTAGESAGELKSVAPVRFIIAKNQNGQAGYDTWFPFVFYKKYCLFMLGDADAAPVAVTTGVGATARTIKDFTPLYSRVTHDWRCDPFEKILKDHGVLTGYDLMRDRFLVGN